MRCTGTVEPLPLLGGTLMGTLERCRLSRGSWEHLAIRAETADALYLADGAPASLPAIEAALGALAGRTERAGPAASGRGSLYGQGELERYDGLMRRASYANNLQNFADAERLYRDALELRARLSGPDSPAIVEPLLHLALQLSNQQRFGEAEALFDRAEALAADAETAPSVGRYAQFYRALHASNQGRATQALTIIREANRQLTQQSATQADAGASTGMVLADEAVFASLGDLATGLYLEGRIEARRGDQAAAERAASAAEAVVARTPVLPRRLAPGLLELRAEIATSRGEKARARDLWGEAVTSWQALYRSSRPEATARLAFGDALAAAGQPQPALAQYRLATGIVRARRESLSYRQVAGYLSLLGGRAAGDPAGEADQRELFDTRQLVRGGITAQSIAQTAARLSSGDDETGRLVRALQDAERARDGLYQRANLLAGEEARAVDELTRRVAREERQRVLVELAAAEVELQAIEPQVQAALATYNQLIDTPVNAEAVLARLGSGEAVLDVLVGLDATWLFLLRSSGVRAVRVPVGAEPIDALVQRVRRSLELDAAGRLQPFDVAASKALHDAIIAPLAAALEEVHHLVLVPSGSLASLPPEILAVEAPDRPADPFDYSSVTWLNERLAVSVVPSARAFVDLRAIARPSAATESYLGFGDFTPGPATAGETSAGRCPAAAQGRELLAPLPETAREVREIAAVLGAGQAATILGPELTEERIAALPLDRYRILHFATHGLLPGELGCLEEPALVVSPAPAGAARGSPGLLDATEIAALRLDADLVVLSACNTAGPAAGPGGGESLSGLARAFFFAGARALVVSHWNVPSEEAVLLLTSTFRNAGERPQAGATIAALRAAQLAMLERGRAASGHQGGAGRERYWTHPFFWGAFTVVGGAGRPAPA